MVTVLVVPDGAADPVGPARTCLERARTPALDRLATIGQLLRVATIPEGCAPGTEMGLPGLLGVRLGAPLPRGLVEAAAAGVALRRGQAAWRLDRPVGQTADASAMDAAVRPLGGHVHSLGGHRSLLVGPVVWGTGPPGPHQTQRPLHEVATGPFAAIAAASGAWPWGRITTEDLPQVPAVVGRAVTVVTAGGAPAGIAQVLGCRVDHGDPVAAVAEAADDAVLVVHCPGPDEAAHARDRAGKVAALEAVDALVGQLGAVVIRRGGELLVCPDHGCDPATGRHTGDPVPALRARWVAGAVAKPTGGTVQDAPAGSPAVTATAGGPDRPPDRLPGGRHHRCTERMVAGLEPTPAHALLAVREAVA